LQASPQSRNVTASSVHSLATPRLVQQPTNASHAVPHDVAADAATSHSATHAAFVCTAASVVHFVAEMTAHARPQLIVALPSMPESLFFAGSVDSELHAAIDEASNSRMVHVRIGRRVYSRPQTRCDHNVERYPPKPS